MSLGNWCAPWSSKPVLDVKSALGEFDSHRHPPEYNEAAESISTAVFYFLKSLSFSFCKNKFIFRQVLPSVLL